MPTPSRRDLANAIRFLAIDAVEASKSGHPGMPMGMADIAEVLWNDYLQHNPNNPKWFNRDRFVLSNGHGSMLQYALLDRKSVVWGTSVQVSVNLGGARIIKKK